MELVASHVLKAQLVGRAAVEGGEVLDRVHKRPGSGLPCCGPSYRRSCAGAALSRGLQPQTLNQIICALRFFYAVTLRKPEAKTELPLARRTDKLPAVLSPAEVARFLNAVPDVRSRAAFATIYAAGLRVSEVVALPSAISTVPGW